MADDLWSRGEPNSPCVKICVIHPEAKLCVGCLRSIGEIAAWGRMSAEERQALLDALPARQPQIAKRRGGRAARADRRSKS
ncbi:DUF1289 domain-containing protein [Pseudooceanicola nitratireducens]|uniref:DUF1289 domain-containing protein n=1 Tax=Pseudooceanicola nitratireducens TaxID=517719 RepID=UPI001C96804C|nr:DUF1289 domain-containing protein [Pseudooceanicola nitratireducens]MBY6165624.1 DUF1289 domain-containing protein [Pseudooceanicola nitratireducens]